MVKLDEYIDLLIPRGGAGLVRFVAAEASMPAITGGVGVCHAYADASARPDMAGEVVLNAKTQAPAKCNALDTLLVHAAAAPAVLDAVAARLLPAGVELRCDQSALSLLGPSASAQVKAASADDFGMEFLDMVLAVRVVDSLDDALEHVARYGSGHSEAILTEDYGAAMRFVDEVDAAVVLVNASTRFNDGGQLGLGAEAAISTNKLHARGPMGLRELTSYKWVALGSGTGARLGAKEHPDGPAIRARVPHPQLRGVHHLRRRPAPRPLRRPTSAGNLIHCTLTVSERFTQDEIQDLIDDLDSELLDAVGPHPRRPHHPRPPGAARSASSPAANTARAKRPAPPSEN